MASLNMVGRVIKPAGVGQDNHYYGDNKSRIISFASVHSSQRKSLIVHCSGETSIRIDPPLRWRVCFADCSPFVQSVRSWKDKVGFRLVLVELSAIWYCWRSAVLRLNCFFSWWETREERSCLWTQWTECWGVGKTDRIITGSDWTVLGPGWIQGVKLSQLTNESIIFQSPGKPKYCLCVYPLAPVPNFRKRRLFIPLQNAAANFCTDCQILQSNA